MTKATRNKFDDMRAAFLERVENDRQLADAFQQLKNVEDQEVNVSGDSVSGSAAKLPYSGATPFYETVWS